MCVFDAGLTQVTSVGSVTHKLGESGTYVGHTLVIGITQFKVRLFIDAFVPDVAELTTWIWAIRRGIAVTRACTAQD